MFDVGYFPPNKCRPEPTTRKSKPATFDRKLFQLRFPPHLRSIAS
jgi:hypothetical protein